MRRNFNGALIAIAMTAATTAPAFAWGGVTINDGFGEQVTVKHGLFGHNTEVVKDRLGDGFAKKNGWFGTKEQDVNVLGNNFQHKKGLFGTNSYQGSSIFGDRITTKKGILGYRSTYVDVSGGANAIRTLWNANKSKILGTSNPGAGLSGVLGGLTGAGPGAGAPVQSEGLPPAPPVEPNVNPVGGN